MPKCRPDLFPDLDGHIGSESAPATVDVTLSEPRVYHNTGIAADYLTKRCFGWLMDEEIDEDDMKPLL